ncbi:MAG: hypothetical protein IAG10_00360 [Planctomycetaceae bacterium]|nr:hypothetical protein [Planctomycetaceae bacterium]
MNYPDSPQWLAAKPRGDAAEMAVAEWFTARGYLVAKTIGAASFDLLLQAHVEVKHDRVAEQTGRVAVEIRYRGQPSGLMTTGASWWAIAIGREAMLLKTDTLRRCVLSGHYPTCFGGDRNAAELVLVPINELRDLEGVFVIPLRGVE